MEAGSNESFSYEIQKDDALARTRTMPVGATTQENQAQYQVLEHGDGPEEQASPSLIQRQQSFDDTFSSITDKEESHNSRSTAQFRSIERMRDSLVNFERIHKLQSTMQEFAHIKKSIDTQEKNQQLIKKRQNHHSPKAAVVDSTNRQLPVKKKMQEKAERP